MTNPSLAIGWLTAFIDVPDDRFSDAARFWGAVTNTTVSETRGDRDQYVTLAPSEGDAYIAMQRFPEERPNKGVHLDLHVDDVAAAVEICERLGAVTVADLGYVIMSSPGGFEFCLVSHDGEHDRGPRLAEPVEHRLDVICVDVAADGYQRERTFWSELTGMPLQIHDDFPQFAGLALRHKGLPLNLLVQQVGHDGPADAHLDVSAGDGVDAVVARHVAHGAIVDRRFDHWVVLVDPAGLPYCVTDRGPD